MSEHLHTTKEGKKIPLSELEDSHLQNILRLHKRKAIEGLFVRSGGGTCPDDFWYDEDEVFGEEALELLGTRKYIAEAQKRGLL